MIFDIRKKLSITSELLVMTLMQYHSVMYLNWFYNLNKSFYEDDDDDDLTSTLRAILFNIRFVA